MATRGQVVLYRLNLLNPLELLSFLWTRHYAHCSIAVDNGNDAIAAVGGRGVCHQFANGSDATFCDIPWKVNFDVVEAWLQEQVGKPYDWWAFLRIAVGLRSPVPKDRFICSSLVAQALALFSSVPIAAHRETTPEQLARILGKL